MATKIRNQATGLYLDSNDQGKAYSLAGSDASNWQNWHVVYKNDNKFVLLNAATDLFLAANSDGSVFTQAHGDDNHDHHMWYHDSGRIINLATGLALSTSHELQLEAVMPSTQSHNQLWSLE
jgi:hypothetical protein